MASVSGSNSGSLHATLTVNVGASSASGNYTAVTWTLTAYDDAGVSWSSQDPVTGTVTINGSVHGYSYTWSSSGTGSRTLASGSANIPHASNGTKTLSFSFTFSGIPGTSNSGGCSGASSVGLPAIAPQTPTGLTVGTQTVPGSVPVSWAAAAGSTPSGYTVQASTSASFTSPHTFNSSSTSTTLTGLAKGTTYYVRVLASNASGSSAYSAAVSTLTLAGAKRWDGAAWAAAPTFKRWNGNSWVTVTTARRWDGSAWVNLS